MTKPIRVEHLQPCVDWWGGVERSGRVETDFAWRVSADVIKERGYNLDIKNPHSEAVDHGDPEELLVQLDKAEGEADRLRDELKSILEEALLR
jgi:type I restriction enzyme M protein